MECLFCEIIAGERSAHWVFDTDDVIGFLDARPVFKGHVLVVPRVHYETLGDIPEELMVPLFGSVQRISRAVVPAYEAQGSFVAANNVISQSVPHLHVHVVPRRPRDGLRGFFWPRTKYADDAEAADYAKRLRTVLDA